MERRQLGRLVAAATLALGMLGTAHAAGEQRVKFSTNQGDFVIEVYPDKAPKTVDFRETLPRNPSARRPPNWSRCKPALLPQKAKPPERSPCAPKPRNFRRARKNWTAPCAGSKSAN